MLSNENTFVLHCIILLIPYDNSVMESFFFNLKREELY